MSAAQTCMSGLEISGDYSTSSYQPDVVYRNNIYPVLSLSRSGQQLSLQILIALTICRNELENSNSGKIRGREQSHTNCDLKLNKKIMTSRGQREGHCNP